MRSLKKYLIFFFLQLSVLYGCTDFLLEDKNHNYVCGRSLEFGTFLPTEITISPRGIKYQSCIKEGKKGKSWKARYGFIGLNLGDSNLVIDGMNEKGLSIGILWFPGAEYPNVTTKDDRKVISFTDLSAWILSSFATCDQVKKGLQKIQVYFFPMKLFHGTPPIHLSIHDRQGNSLVVEFFDKKMHLIDNPVAVCTNSPKLEWHLTNLRNYINLTAMNKGTISFNHTVLTPMGQGSGMLGIPGDWTPPSRFVRIAIYKDFVMPAGSNEKNVNLAFHLLNTVDIPYGAIRSKKGEDFDYTQWIVVKDLQKNSLYYRTYDNLDIKEISLLEKDIKKGKSIKRIPLQKSQHAKG